MMKAVSEMLVTISILAFAYEHPFCSHMYPREQIMTDPMLTNLS